MAANDAPLGIGISCDITDDVDDITHHDALAAELAGFDGEHWHVGIHQHTESTAIHRGHHAGLCFGMSGTILGTRPRLTAPRTNANVVLI